jgi:hypothetical protein
MTSTEGAAGGAPGGGRASVSLQSGVAAFSRPCKLGPGGSGITCSAANASSSRKEPPHSALYDSQSALQGSGMMARERRLASTQPKAWRGAHLACSATGSAARSRRTAPALGFFACFGCRAAAGGCCALAALSAAGGAAFCLRGGGTSSSTAAAGRAGGGSAAAASRSRLRFFSFFVLRSAAPPKLGPSSTSPVVTSVTTTRGIAPSIPPGEGCWLVKPVRRVACRSCLPRARRYAYLLPALLRTSMRSRA